MTNLFVVVIEQEDKDGNIYDKTDYVTATDIADVFRDYLLDYPAEQIKKVENLVPIVRNIRHQDRGERNEY